MKRIVIIFSVMIFIIANVGLSQDIINEMGKDGKFIVRDADEQEALIIEDGNVGITGELSVENMPEGSASNPYVVWDPEDKKFKTVARVFSRISPLSKPLESRSWHSLGYGEVDGDGNVINASVQGTAVAWNQLNTDYGYISFGPANATRAHIYTNVLSFLFNKPVYALHGIFGSLGNDLQFRIGNSTPLFVKSTNKHVGIGTKTPVTKLQIEQISNHNWNSGLSLAYKGNLWKIMLEGTWGLTFGYNNSAKMVIGTNGRVGIGDTSPDYKLDVAGTANLNDGIKTGIFLRAYGVEAAYYDHVNTLFSWGYGGTKNYFADRVGIGTNTPLSMLHVKHSTSGHVARIQNNTNTTTADGMRIVLQPNLPGSSNHYIEFVRNGGSHYTGYIVGNGIGVKYTTASDARLKMNIVNYPSALEKVSKIRVVQYEPKAAPGIEQIGFLAQELQKIYPQAVAGDPAGDVEKEPMTIDYGRITPLLVKAIQELQARIEVLERR